MEDGITGTDVREESIAQALSSMSTLYQASNVHNIQKSWNFTTYKDSVNVGEYCMVIAHMKVVLFKCH